MFLPFSWSSPHTDSTPWIGRTITCVSAVHLSTAPKACVTSGGILWNLTANLKDLEKKDSEILSYLNLGNFGQSPSVSFVPLGKWVNHVK